MTSDNIKSTVMLAGIGVAAYVAWKTYQGAAAVKDTITGLTSWALPKTPEQYKADYSLGLSKAKEDAAANPFTSYFTSNPNNFAPADLVPAGYTVNQYGDLVQKGSAGDLGYSSGAITAAARADADRIQSGGGGTFNGNGASGTW